MTNPTRIHKLSDGTALIAIDSHLCRLERSTYGDWWVRPPEGFYASRIGCDCKAISILSDTSCSCAPGDLSMPPCLKAKLEEHT